jgi:hypothetical protein
MKRKQKPYWEMTTAELREATKEFDKPSSDNYGFGKPTPVAKAQLARAKRRGRPTVGKGATSVLISIERGLLTKADRLAKRHKVSRSELIAAGLRVMLKAG